MSDGVMKYNNGDQFEGIFSGVYKHSGKMKFANGLIYEGTFENDEMNGRVSSDTRIKMFTKEVLLMAKKRDRVP